MGGKGRASARFGGPGRRPGAADLEKAWKMHNKHLHLAARCAIMIIGNKDNFRIVIIERSLIPMILIGEKINGSIPSMAKAIAERDEEWIKKVAKQEA